MADQTKTNQQKQQFEKMPQGSVPKLLLTLSVPTIISMMVTNIYNIADTAFVGTLGTSQSGATGIVFSFMAILQAVAFMCGQGWRKYHVQKAWCKGSSLKQEQQHNS